MPSETLEIVYTWEDGREEVRYRRPYPSEDACKMIGQVREIREQANERRYKSPYSWRITKQGTGYDQPSV